MEINKKSFAEASSLSDRTVSCPDIKLWNWQTSVLQSVETRFLLSDFALQVRRENRRYSHLLPFTWRCWYISNSGSESESRIQQEMELVQFENLNVTS